MGTVSELFYVWLFLLFFVCFLLHKYPGWRLYVYESISYLYRGPTSIAVCDTTYCMLNFFSPMHTLQICTFFP